MVHCLNFVLACMTSSCHSEDHISLNRKCTVVILYQLCFGLSQKCNFLQDNGLRYFNSFVIFPKLGLKPSNFCSSSKVLHRYRANICKEHTTSTVGNDYYLIYGKYFCP